MLCPKISRQKIFSTFNINFTSSVSSFLTFPSNNPATFSWFFGQIFSHSSSALVHSGGQMPVFKCPMHALFLSHIQALIYFSDFGPLLVIANALFVRSWQLRIVLTATTASPIAGNSRNHSLFLKMAIGAELWEGLNFLYEFATSNLNSKAEKKALNSCYGLLLSVREKVVVVFKKRKNCSRIWMMYGQKSCLIAGFTVGIQVMNYVRA